MRKLQLFTFVLCLICLSSSVLAEEHTTTGQLMIAVGRDIGDAELSKSAHLSCYVHGTALMDFGTMTPMLFTYVGPKLSLPKTTLWLLGGTFMSPDGGTSALASVWMEQTLGLDELLFFLEGDVYFPLSTEGDGEHTFRQYYILSTLMYNFEKWGVGLFTEHFLSEDDWFEAAFGGGISAGSAMFWLGYDISPADKETNMFLFRLQLNL